MVRPTRHASAEAAVSVAVQRPNRSPVLVVAIAAVALVAVGLVTLGVSRTPVAPTGSTPPTTTAPSEELSSSPDIAIDAGVCALKQQPGPEDAPPKAGGDLMDTADDGGGRWRICLTDPATVIAEGTAWCVWNDGRTAVVEINGVPVAAGGGVAVDGGVSARDGRTFIGLTAPNGTVRSYG